MGQCCTCLRSPAGYGPPGYEEVYPSGDDGKDAGVSRELEDCDDCSSYDEHSVGERRKAAVELFIDRLHDPEYFDGLQMALQDLETGCRVVAGTMGSWGVVRGKVVPTDYETRRRLLGDAMSTAEYCTTDAQPISASMEELDPTLGKRFTPSGTSSVLRQILYERCGLSESDY